MGSSVEMGEAWRKSLRTVWIGAWTMALMLSLACSRPTPGTKDRTKDRTNDGATDEAYRAEIERWRAEREAPLKPEEEEPSVAGLFVLEEGAWTMGSAEANDIRLPEGAPSLVGVVELVRGRVYISLAEGMAPQLNDEAAPEAFELRPAQANPQRPADRLQLGRLTLIVHRSGPRITLRLRKTEGPVVHSFTGVRWFPIDERYRISACFIEYGRPRRVPGINVQGDAISNESPGEAELTIDGRTVRLQAWDDAGRLWFLFRDRLAGSETYGIRELYADPPRDGRVLLDFNRSYNLPCADSPCPTPPPQNVLTDVAIPAGEVPVSSEPVS
ncbi:MAG: DUF1684 domain-containing protein [Luteitalea sp.]|nr:DUF1684 domain-containing protein [Luteitalea sp.]